MASGYDRVVPDGEGLWLELSEEQIFKHSFRKDREQLQDNTIQCEE